MVRRNIRPELLAIRLANSPLCSFVDRAFEVDEIAPKIYVLPFWIGTDRARAPKPETATLKKAETVVACESAARTHGIMVRTTGYQGCRVAVRQKRHPLLACWGLAQEGGSACKRA